MALGIIIVNDLVDVDDDKEPTNITKLHKLYFVEDGKLLDKVYIEGIGTTANEKDSTLDMGFAFTFGDRIQEAIIAMTDHFELFGNSRVGIIDVLGFSRGAAAARTFVNEVHRLTLNNPKTWGGLKPQFRFLGLFDTVGSVGVAGDNDNDNIFARGDLRGPITLDVHPDAVKHAVHLTAGDEMREYFPLSSLVPINRPMPSH